MGADTNYRYTSLEKVIDVLVGISLLVFWVVVYCINQTNKGAVPTHFNIQGTADAFGDTQHLYASALLNTLLIAGLYVLKLKNVPLNMGQQLTENNKKPIMQVMRQTLSLLALSIAVIFGIVLYETITYQENATPYSFIIILFSIKVPLIFYYLKTQNIKS